MTKLSKIWASFCHQIAELSPLLELEGLSTHGHSPLKQEPRGEAVHRDGEEALGLRAVDVHRNDLLHPRHLQHPGDQLGRDRLPPVCLLVIAPANDNDNDLS